ncbi:MAG: tRNA preQ1(34) S-adenosylmethionine ribosyltransferase-isomerase QueA [Vulcanimicrobiaceae bacterium]
MRDAPAEVATPPRDVAAYHYELPEALIAQEAIDPPDAARLMVVGDRIEHRTFRELPDLLRADDLLVLNRTHVERARLRGVRVPSGGAVEALLLRPEDGGRFDFSARRWEALVRPARRLHLGARIAFGCGAEAEVVAERADGLRILRFAGDVDLERLLADSGELPLPPYVHGASVATRARYQTIFAQVPGSVAAPTASLHFTPGLLAALDGHGIERVSLALDVGYGTFRPMEGRKIDEHRMHAERFEIPAATARAIVAARVQRRRVVAIGTTVLRALEAAVGDDGALRAGERETDLFVTPGFCFRVVDVLVTNFHLPGSTLLVLASAFAGYERILEAYRVALAERYRFLSFGDAMLLEKSRSSRLA